ncbi:MAG: GHKL domain-containing protein [Lachnospiraceae bacterium]|jgi:two-component system sensor histidine kinase AgrC|nr:GHKL domain-containing protein [Lachnospiraceae bacterium]
MEQTLQNIIIICVVDAVLSHLSLYLYLSAFLGPQMRWRRLWPLFAVLIVLCTALNVLQIMTSAWSSYILSSVIVYLGNLFVVWFLWERRLSRASVCLTIAAILQMGTLTMLNTLKGDLNIWDPKEAVWFFCVLGFGYPGLTLVGRTLLNRARLPEHVRALMERTEHPVRLALGVLGLEILVEIFFLMKNTMKIYFFGTYFITALLLLLGILFVLVYLSMKAETQAKLEAQRALLAQQSLYVQSLERMQQEMRSFRHDYKNMMSGLYLSASEGDLRPVREMLQSMTNCFDERVGEDIRQSTQLGNIRIIEVKSLVLTKMMEMQKKGIRCNLEVLYPLTRIDMDILDVTRCLGILLDNAVEAAGEMERREVDLLISSLDTGVTIVVKNPVTEVMDLNRIWESGISTKGEGRGLGLSIYREITGKYANVARSTSCRDSQFIQEWRIANRRGR